MKKYKYAWWRLQHWPLVVLAVVTLVQVVRSLTNPGVELVPLWLRMVVIAGGLLMMGILVWSVAQFFANYLQISSEGIGERRWPGKFKLVPWEKVDSVRQYATLGIFRSDVLVFKEIQAVSETENKEVLNIFNLSDYQGWPKGDLASELRKRRPQAFK